MRITTAALALGLALGSSGCAWLGGGPLSAEDPTYADCVDMRNMGAALSSMCQYLLDQGPYDQDLSSQGGGTPGGGGGGSGSPGE